MTRHEAKASLKTKGITQEKAAKAAGVTYEHLNRVLNGHRTSRRLLAKIEALPEMEKKKEAA